MVATAMTWGQKIQKAFGAFAFEHSGEMMPLSRKHDVLSGIEPSAATSRTQVVANESSPKSLLVAFNEILHMDLLEYAIESAKQHGVDIHFLSKLSHQEVHDKVSDELAKHSVEWNVFNSNKECVMDDITTYNSESADLLCVVTSHEDTLSKRYISEQPKELSGKAPWIVIKGQRDRAA